MITRAWLTSADCVAVYKAFLSGENNLKQSQEKLTSKRELLQKACDGIGFVSGLKEIMSKIKEDEQWCITRPPFCNLDQDKKAMRLAHPNPIQEKKKKLVRKKPSSKNRMNMPIKVDQATSTAHF